MKKPAVDYRQFRLSRLQEPQFSHLKLLLGWVVYFLFFFFTETMIPPEDCYSVHCSLDDRIPFCELFLLPYVFWYGLILFSLVYFGLYDVASFRNLSIYIMITQTLSVFCYIAFPTRQDLRPAVFPRDNFLTQCIGVLYRIDTNTGVCPSFHVACSIAIASVWIHAPGIKKCWKGFVAMAAAMICLSTMFIKQHSAVDFFAALPVCALGEWFVFGIKRLRQ